jgi:hypothetical protein
MDRGCRVKRLKVRFKKIDVACTFKRWVFTLSSPLSGEDS